jgi:hypothetical protein
VLSWCSTAQVALLRDGTQLA